MFKYDLDAVSEWATNNKMFVNTTKTKSLLVTGKRIAKKLGQEAAQCLKTMLDKTEIPEVSSHKLLGVTLERNMAYDLHIDELCNKLSKRLGLFKHISPYLKQKQRETYFNRVIKPTLMYGSISCCAESLQRVLKLQKRAARIILNEDSGTPPVTLFNKLNWLPFTKQSLIKRNTLACKRVDSSYKTPSYIDNLLIRNSDIHQRETCYSNSNLLCLKYSRKTEGGRTFAVRTITEWNSIDSSIRNKGSVASF